jgi:hypothetical protein
MKQVLNKIWKIINSRIFYIVLIAIFIFFLGKSCNNNEDIKTQQIKTEQNLRATSDTLKMIRKENGNLEASISSYVATEKELKDLNKSLYRKIEQQEGEIVSLNSIVFRLKQDTTELRRYINDLITEYGVPEAINDSTYIIPWTLAYDYGKNNYDIFKGVSKVGVSNVKQEDGKLSYDMNHYNSELVERETGIELDFGQKVEDDKLRVYAESNYPGFTVDQLQGVLLDPNENEYIRSLIKKKHFIPNEWTVSLSVSAGYDIFGQKPVVIIGPSIGYTIYKW